MDASCDVLIIGGGFYGLYLAQHLAARVDRVLVVEREPALMRRASYANQARVHQGYHYPRSVLTASRSRANFPRFVEEFRPAIETGFEKVYAIARRFSKVTADQFLGSMRRIGAPIRPASKDIASLFDPSYIEAAFLTCEYAFNSAILCQLMTERLERAGVAVQLSTEVRRVEQAPGGAVRVELQSARGAEEVIAGQVFCCAYAQLNSPLAGADQRRVPLKHELTELALVEPPPALAGLGITVMDGPFFSLMPFPDRKLHTLSHVRYTPHAWWHDGEGSYRPAYEVLAAAPRETAFAHMVRDAARFLPAAARCRYADSLWEIKTVLPQSEMDDSRPILFRPHFGLENYHLVMGGKVDNVYDIVDVIDSRLKLLSREGLA